MVSRSTAAADLAHPLERWQHDHTFGLDRPMPGEGPTRVVLGLTAVTMAIEIVAGMAFGSMALLADGLHMGSHAAALGISAAAYTYARRHAGDTRFSFGTGKVNALGGFSGALLLAVFALVMAWESLLRLLAPEPIQFDHAIEVAVLGLAVNGVSVWLLGPGGDQDQPTSPRGADDSPHPHHHELEGHHHHDHRAHRQAHDQTTARPHAHGTAHDHNLRSAYLHVLADALTSVLAIVALLAGKFLGWVWLDPAMGILGALLVTRWSVSLIRETTDVLLDREGPENLRHRIREAIERGAGDAIADLHLWSVGPARWAAIVSVVTHSGRPAAYYRSLLPKMNELVHATVEVLECDEAGCRWLDPSGARTTDSPATASGALRPPGTPDRSC